MNIKRALKITKIMAWVFLLLQCAVFNSACDPQAAGTVSAVGGAVDTATAAPIVPFSSTPETGTGSLVGGEGEALSLAALLAGTGSPSQDRAGAFTPPPPGIKPPSPETLAGQVAPVYDDSIRGQGVLPRDPDGEPQYWNR